jgi:hypothetical protein
VGQQIRIGGGEWLTVIGVTSDGRQRLSEAAQAEVFFRADGVGERSAGRRCPVLRPQRAAAMTSGDDLP